MALTNRCGQTRRPEPGPNEVRSYDFNNQMRIVRGRMADARDDQRAPSPRLFRVSLYNMLRRTAEISVQPIQVKKFSEYVHTLHVPTSLNLVKMNPLRGNRTRGPRAEARVSLPWTTSFGGTGPPREDRRSASSRPPSSESFTWCCAMCFSDLHEGVVARGSHRARVRAGPRSNPHFANIVSPVRNRRRHQFPTSKWMGAAANLHVTMALLHDRAVCARFSMPALASDRVEKG